jgi:hypothetical protein
MIAINKLNILNGQVMYDYFKKKKFLNQEVIIPFNEAMCFGNTSTDLFSIEFVKIRSKVHHVTPSQYDDITLTPLQPLFRKNFSSLALWFDADMFCQINLLTILAWLDKNEYEGTIDFHLVGEHFEPVEHFKLEAKGYFELYYQVMIHKTRPDFIYPPPLKKGIELYLDYLKNDSNLMTYIEMNQNLSEKELVLALIEKFKDYGLGDTQYLEIIKDYRKTNMAN